MQTARPYVLTIAGFDPCSGAGLTADIKAFEQSGVYGLAVCTGLTVQTESEFHSVSWRKIEDVKHELDILLKKYPVKAVKFGIVPSFSFLNELVTRIHNLEPSVKIVVDPVWRTSTGFELNPEKMSASLLQRITLLTPNLDEMKFMANGMEISEAINDIVQHTNLLLKGGHAMEKIGTDFLYQGKEIIELSPAVAEVFSKHGSGCVLSAVITAELAKGSSLEIACVKGKKYTERFLQTNKSRLGYHAA